MALTLCIVRIVDFKKDPVAFILSQTSDGIKDAITNAYDTVKKDTTAPFKTKEEYEKTVKQHFTEALESLAGYIGGLHHSGEIDPEEISFHLFSILRVIFTAAYAKDKYTSQKYAETLEKNLSAALADQFRYKQPHDEMLQDLYAHFSHYPTTSPDTRELLQTVAKKHRRNPVFVDYVGLGEDPVYKFANEFSKGDDMTGFQRNDGIFLDMKISDYIKGREMILAKNGPATPGTGITEIIPRKLYLGNAGFDASQRAYYFDKVIGACKLEDIHDSLTKFGTVYSLPVDDKENDVTSKSFYDVKKGVMKSILRATKNSKTLVCSPEGNTRSALLVMIYLCTAYDVSGTEAYDFVKAKRPTVFTKVSAPKYWEILQLFN